MNDSPDYFRNPTLMCRDDTALVVVDVQQRLCSAITDSTRLAWNVARLVQGARILGMPVWATEQYPEKLGATVQTVRQHLPNAAEAKLRFSMGQCPATRMQLQQQPVAKLLVVGIETHVCVMQSALDLLAAGWDVYVAADAVAARHAVDHDTALQRMHAAGVTLTTTEMALFEWCEVAGSAEFKAISALVRQPEPTENRDF